ncbi:membrane protein [Pontibacter korlensis]|uniref:Membrane protein n=1 Tax=Pontibacter korlensis TaxID=400092 RepID=A0A0E3ZJ05_9BACT|nr:membrane protein [Pontibacter korlensis]
MRNWVIRYTFFFLGLLCFGLGIAISVKVKHLGLHPWDVLNVAFSEKFGWSIGTWSVIVGMVLILISLFVSRKYINIGTFLNALLIGPFMDFFLWMDILPQATYTWFDYVWLLAAMLIIGIGGGLYVAGGIGAGPRDGFMLTISDRTGLSVSKARISVECVVLVVGFLLGGPIHIVTFLYTFILSPVFQVSLNVFARLREVLCEKGPSEAKV